MNTTTRSAAETKELIWLTLQDHTDWVTSQALAEEVGVSKWTIMEHMKKLRVEHPEIISSRSFGYKITAPKKNSEGYSDPTASAAINTVCDSQSGDKDKEYNTSYYGACYDNILPGTLWETASSKGDPEYFFVVVDWVNGGPMAFGIPMYPDSYGQIDLTVSSILHGDFYGSMSQIRCKPMKYFKSEVTIKCSSDALTTAKSLVTNLIGFDEVVRGEHKAGYNEGYFKGIEDGKKAAEEEHKEALAEEHQRGLREGTDKGFDKGYIAGYDTGKKESEDLQQAQAILDDDISKIESEDKPLTIDDADVVQLITERNLYKNFYEQLLEVMKS